MTPKEVVAKAERLGAPAELIRQYKEENGLLPEPEPFREELDLLRKAEELGAPAELIEEFKQEKGITAYREKLLGEQVANEQRRARADYQLDAATDTPLENLQEGAQGMLYGAYIGGTGLVDLGTSYLRGLYNQVADKPISSVRDLFPEEANEYKGPEEPLLSGLTQAVGEAPMIAGAFAPVAGRSLATASGAVSEFLGAGTAEAGAVTAASKTFADVLNRRTTEALNNQIPIENLRQLDLTNDFQVKYWANRLNEEAVIANNSRNIADVEKFDDWMSGWANRYEAAEEQLANASSPEAIKKAEKKLDKLADEFADQPMYEMEGPKYNLGTVMSEVATRFDVDPVEFSKALTRVGGLDTIDELSSVVQRERFRQSQQLFSDATSDAKAPGFFASTFRPVVSIVRERVGKGASARFERAFESAARGQEKLFMWYAERAPEVTEVRKWMDQDDVKSMFLDLQFTGKNGMARIMEKANESLSPTGRQIFMKLVSDVRKHNARASRLYKDEVLKDEEFWPSALARVEDRSDLGKINAIGETQGRPTSVAGTQARLRGPTTDQPDLDLSQYENPFKAAMDRMAAEQNLIELSEKFNLSPALDKNGTTVDFFNAAEKEFGRMASPEKAALLRQMMEQTVEGSRRRPPKMLELFMKQSYAGTLGQFDSAMLNFHDIAVSMWRNGLTPTIRAMIDNQGMDIRQMGITNDATSLEEFRAGFDGVLDDKGTAEKLVDSYSNVAFKVSGFQWADRIGKGVTLRAAHNRMKDAAKKGTLVKDFGYLMDPKELARITPALKKGTRLADLKGEEKRIMEELMFARLGEQQLISMAGRPLNYLKNPSFRPFWALSGFAVKQADLLKLSVVDEVAKGNFKAAGQAAAGYLGYVALGYAIADTARKLPSYAITGEDRKAPTAENFVKRAGEQVAGAVTLNKLGDEYALRELSRDPVDYAYGTFEPPSGAIGYAAKDIGRALQEDKEFRGYVFKGVPLFGDFMYDWWNK